MFVYLHSLSGFQSSLSLFCLSPLHFLFYYPTLFFRHTFSLYLLTALFSLLSVHSHSISRSSFSLNFCLHVLSPHPLELFSQLSHSISLCFLLYLLFILPLILHPIFHLDCITQMFRSFHLFTFYFTFYSFLFFYFILYFCTLIFFTSTHNFWLYFLF